MFRPNLTHMLEIQGDDFLDYRVARWLYNVGAWGRARNKQLVAQVRSAETREDYETYTRNHV
jgi:hypothetical protein